MMMPSKKSRRSTCCDQSNNRDIVKYKGFMGQRKIEEKRDYGYDYYIIHIIQIRYSSMNRLHLLKAHISSQKEKPLKGKTVVISGASRGIGLAIGVKCAQDGANVAILAKTTTPQPTLPGTIYTAAAEIEKAGGKALAIACDIRSEQSVKSSIDQVLQKFGGIDILINNASAINLVGTIEQSMKKYDLMHQINTRGTFLLSKYCLPHLLKANNPHILNLSPPLSMKPRWFSDNLAYTMAKYGMSMCVLGMAEEFKGKVAVNALWPRTAVATAAVQNILGGDQAMKRSRNTDIIADAAYLILTSDKNNSGNFFIDEDVLKKHGITEFGKYRFIKDDSVKEQDLIVDFFLQ